MNNIEVKRLKPLLTFEVITEDNVMYHIQAQSYEAGGNYITFYQAVTTTETIENEVVNKHTGEVTRKNEVVTLKKKLPFLTLRNIYKISLINFKDEFELIKEIGPVYKPSQTVEIKNIENHYQNTEEDEHKIKRFYERQPAYPQEDMPFGEDTEQNNYHIEDNVHLTSDETLGNEQDFNFLNDLINVSEEKRNSLQDNNDDDEIQAFLNQQENEPNDLIEQSKLNIINKLNNKDINSSEVQKEVENEKQRIIKENLKIYLQKITTHFTSKSFYRFLQDRVNQNIIISEDEIIIQVCNMIKNREIDYQKFYNQKSQDLINANKNAISYNYNGDMLLLLETLHRRKEENRQINMIDLTVYLTRTNYFN